MTNPETNNESTAATGSKPAGLSAGEESEVDTVAYCPGSNSDAERHFCFWVDTSKMSDAEFNELFRSIPASDTPAFEVFWKSLNDAPETTEETAAQVETEGQSSADKQIEEDKKA